MAACVLLVRGDRMAGVEDQCQASFVGTIPTQAASCANWAVEMLLLVLHCESCVVGSLWTLPETER